MSKSPACIVGECTAGRGDQVHESPEAGDGFVGLRKHKTDGDDHGKSRGKLC